MTFDLQQVAGVLGHAAPAAVITGWSVDTRTLEPGDLFFALPGPHHDGHDFLDEAFRKGAVAAVAEQHRTATVRERFLLVPDTLAALEQIAGWARARWGGRVIGVTGSAGKTTTKEIIADLLAVEMRVGKTIGNLNNHVGLPLSILRLPAEARTAVLEIGMNHPGEIRRLASIARPDVGVVTNVGFAHAEFFESVDGVALAKRELIEALPAGGVAVLNADDPRVASFRDVHPGPVTCFGTSPEADVRPAEVEYSPAGVRFRLGQTDFECSLVGRHGLLNVLAGIAVAGVFGIAPERLREAVRSLAPGKMRGERFTHAGITILNDCYNSNPEAVRSMLEVLRATPARRRIAVLGEMLELGRWTEPLHRDVGDYAVACGVDVLVGIRGAASRMVDEAVRSGLPAVAAFFFDDPAPAGDFLRTLLEEGDAVLFKGSRGAHVETALERFLA
jgi:UDP-N-acetylmuramoyl-tripeptide--D-alanyl-D-alanine ligase